MAELAERGARLLAATVDELILLGISLPLAFGAIPLAARLIDLPDLQSLDSSTMSGSPGAPSITDLLYAMATGPGGIITGVALIAWCVITTWLVATNGQSIGKRLVGIKIVRSDGSRASLARIFLLRNVVNALPNLLPYVGWLYQLIDPLFIYQASRQCVHDRIADTIVVRCR